MRRKLQGIMIRRRRQEQNWSQATLCAGICAVSHLSKIERGGEGSPEVLHLLRNRLGIPWREDPEFCRESSAWFEDWYDRLFSGENVDALGPLLTQRHTVYQNTPFFLDWFMLTWQTGGEPPEDVKEWVPAMDERQYSLYLCLTKQFEKLSQISERSYFQMEEGKRSFYQGEYARAIACFQRGMDRAYREGSLRIIMECCGNLGTCYSLLNQLEQTREYFAIANRMARSLGNAKDMAIIAYNLATTELQLGLEEESLRHFLEHPWNEAIYYQKLAICYERLGQTDKSRAALNQAMSAPMTVFYTETAGAMDPAQERKIFQDLCRLIRIRLDNPAYLKDPAYGNLLVSCISRMKSLFSMGFIQFYADWLEDWYVANRQYRKAYEVLRSFFTNREN